LCLFSFQDVSNRFVRESIDKRILKLLCYNFTTPCILVLNKIDSIPKSRRIYDLVSCWALSLRALIYWLPGVDFTNILHAAFTHTDPKSTKNTVKLSVFLVLLGSSIVKALQKNIGEINSRTREPFNVITWRPSNFDHIN